VCEAPEQNAVEVAEDRLERLWLVGRRLRKRRTDLTWLDRGEHRKLADSLEV